MHPNKMCSSKFGLGVPVAIYITGLCAKLPDCAEGGSPVGLAQWKKTTNTNGTKSGTGQAPLTRGASQ